MSDGYSSCSLTEHIWPRCSSWGRDGDQQQDSGLENQFDSGLHDESMKTCVTGWLKTFDGYYEDQTKHILNNMLIKLSEDSRWSLLDSRLSLRQWQNYIWNSHWPISFTIDQEEDDLGRNQLFL